jgi:hypothetical protein
VLSLIYERSICSDAVLTHRFTVEESKPSLDMRSVESATVVGIQC